MKRRNQAGLATRSAIRLVSLLLAISLSGCVGLIDRISGSGPNSPASLARFQAEKTLETLWQRRIGDSSGIWQPALIPVVAQDKIYAAAADGQVRALDAATGALHWHRDLQTPVTAGVSLVGGTIILGTQEGEVIALATQDGSEQWRTTVSSSVSVRPVVAQNRIVIAAADGSLTGLNLAGEQQWYITSHLPRLGLQGMSTPVVQGDQLLQTTTQGELSIRELATGELFSSIEIALPTGRSIVQRLIDSDTDPLVHQGMIYAATYQGGLIAIDGQLGLIRWRQPFSTYRNLAADEHNLYAIGEDSSLWAFAAQTGALNWEQSELLRYRAISDPLVLEDALVLGDMDGYLHLLAADDGRLLARELIGQAAISAGLMTVDGILYVQDDVGYLSAVRVID
jgi:outer membrane protein assembly factor BamB